MVRYIYKSCFTHFLYILLLDFPCIFRELLKFVFVIAAFACLLNSCLTLNITCINLIIMTYATSDHWPLKDGLRIGHLNINHLINKMSDASHIVHSMAGVFIYFVFLNKGSITTWIIKI